MKNTTPDREREWLDLWADFTNHVRTDVEVRAFLSVVVDKAKEEERGRMIALLPVIEVMRDKGQYAMKYRIGEDHVQTMWIDEDISDNDKITIVLKTVAGANRAYKEMSSPTPEVID